jgi:L-rhamnose mutarotase
MARVAVVLKVKPDREGAYREWLEQPIEQLEDVYARHGVHAKTVLMAGRRFIAHYEADEKEGVQRAFSDPESAAILQGELADILDLEEKEPTFYEEIFAWSVPRPGPFERAGLVLTIKPGHEEAYRDWLASGVLEELEKIWHRNEIYRHDVLAAGTSLVAYYECKSRFNVLKAFREPEALVMLLGQLSQILDLDPHTPLSLFQEVYAWEAARERQPA